MYSEEIITKVFFDGRAFNYVAKIDNYGKKSVRSRHLSFYGSEGRVFAEQFLEIVNKEFGTNYEYNEAYKERLGKKNDCNQYCDGFLIKKAYLNSDKYEIIEKYHYDDVANCKCSLGEDFTKETLIKLADAIDEWHKGVVKKETNFHPEYVQSEKREKAFREYALNVGKYDTEIQNAVDALKAGGMEGDALTKASSAIKAGYDWSYVSNKERMEDAIRNANIDEEEIILTEAMKHIKRYKDYFNREIDKHTKDRYFSLDDRYHNSYVFLRYRDTYHQDTNFRVSVSAIDGEIQFGFYGEIVKKAAYYRDPDEIIEFDVQGLTYEEMLQINDLYNEMWHEMYWGKK